MVGRERGKGQIMLSEEWLRMILEDREREIAAAKLVHDAQSATSPRSGLRRWVESRLAETPAPAPVCPQTGRAATDPSA